jgi:hypothetical protein
MGHASGEYRKTDDGFANKPRRKHSNPLREPDAPHQGIRDFKIIVAPTSGFAFSQENSMPLNSYIYAAKQTVSQTRR